MHRLAAPSFLLVLSVSCLIAFSMPFAVDHMVSLGEMSTAAHPASKYSRVVGEKLPTTHVINGSIPVCSGGNRRASGATCLVDADTGWENGVKWRLLDVDTPELNSAACTAERLKAVFARNRLQELMSAGYRIEWTGRQGRYGRELVRITLADGRDASSVLLRQGLAQPWPNTGNIWCAH